MLILILQSDIVFIPSNWPFNNNLFLDINIPEPLISSDFIYPTKKSSSNFVFANSVVRKFFTESFTEEIEESDYGLMIGATLPIKNKLGMNIGYYHSLDEMEFNNVFIELNLFL